MGEFLLNIFVLNKIRTKEIKIKELDLAVFLNMPENEYVEPVFKKDYAAIAVPCSNFYAPYLSVWLQSMVETSSSKNNYDIVVLQDDITTKNQKKLLEIIKNHPNFSLRFYNPSRYLDKSEITIQKKYLSSVSSYRVTLNKFMKGYDKVIVAEVDMIFKHDIKELFDTDIKNAPIAAVVDCVNIKNYNLITWLSDFVLETLKMTDKYRYTNTGVMILNIEEFNKNEYSEKLIEMLKTNTYSCLEQDAMNSLFDNSIYLLDSKWNFLVCDEEQEKISKDMPAYLYKIWKETEKNPDIIHWCGQRKPWSNPDEYLAYEWWNIARRTPYYEEILKRNFQTPASKVPVPANINYRIVVAAIQKRKIYYKYWKYRILQNFAFGKKRSEYRAKKRRFKEQYDNVKKFIRTYKNA